jgi:gliding motility-associated-like protein
MRCNFRNSFFFFILIFLKTGMQAQTNIAPLATVTASTCNAGPCSAFNNLDFGICGTQQVWVNTGSPPSPFAGVNFIEWNWTSNQTMNEMVIHHANTNTRFLTGALIQFWDGTAWQNHHTFSNLPQVCSNTVSFPTLTTNRMRITSFQMTGTGQLSNPNFREIEIFSNPTDSNDAGVANLLNQNSLCAGQNDLTFRIENFGLNTIDSVMLNWQVNGGAIQSQWISGPINPPLSTPPNFIDATVGTVTIIQGLNTINAWTSLPNNLPDPNPTNDSFSTSFTTGISGNVTINSLQPTAGTNFNSFNDLASVLNAVGVCGPLVVDVVPGGLPYTERVVFQTIPGVSTINTVTINGNGNTLTHTAANSAERTTLSFDNTKHFSVNDLIIEASSPVFAWATYLTSSADSNTFFNCQFISNSQNFCTGCSGAVISGNPVNNTIAGENAEYVRFDSCTFIGGRYGLVANGLNTSEPSKGLEITNSNFVDQLDRGIYLRYNSHFLIESNTISRPNVSIPRFYSGIEIQFNSTASRISKNRIFDMNNLSMSVDAIRVTNNLNTATEPLEIVNNLVHNLNNTLVTNGLQIGGNIVGHYKILHNSYILNNNKAGVNTTVNAFNNNSNQVASTYEYSNNLVVLGGNSNVKRVFNINTNNAANASTFRNNVYFSEPGSNFNIGFIVNTFYQTLAAWQAAVSDQNSVFENPQFSPSAIGQPDYYRPTNNLLVGMGTNVFSRVNTDIEYSLRSLSPDPGAFNIAFTPAPYDAGVTALLHPDTVCGDSTMLEVRIRNYGSQIIDSVQVSYQVNGGAISTSWVNGPIDTNNSANGPFLDVFLGPVSFPSASLNDVKLWTSLPNNQIDTVNINDTITSTVISLMSGTVTIDPNQPTGLGNFNSFTDFATEVNTNGICGPVIVNVAPSSPSFNERIVFNQINGMSVINTITINGNGNTLTHTAGSSNQRTTLVLDGTDHMTINDLTIEATGSTHAWVMQLFNTADSNAFNNCHFKAPYSANASSNVHCVVLSNSLVSPVASGNTGNFNHFDGCLFEGGTHGLILRGIQNGSCTGNKITNSEFLDFIQFGITATNQSNLSVISSEFSCPNKTLTSTFIGYTGIRAENVNASVFYGNRFHSPSASSVTTQVPANGINIFPGLTNTTDNSEVLIANNLMYNFNNRGATYGIQVGIGLNNKLKILHNSIIFEQPKLNQNIFVYGILYNANNQYEIKNNLIHLNTSSNNQRCIHLNTSNTSPQQIIDFNSYYLENNQGRVAVVGNTNYPTLANWQSTGNESNGFYGDAQFLRVPSTPDFYRPANSSMIGIADNQLSDVPDDIFGMIRLPSPDPGAINIVTQRSEWDAGVSQLIFPDTVCGDSTMLTLRINNFGTTVIDSVQVHWQTNGAPPQSTWIQGPIDTIGGGNAFIDAILGPASLIPAHNNTLTAWTSLPNNQNDTVNFNDTLNASIRTLLSGTVTINPALPTGLGNFNSFTDFANEVNTNGICGPVIANVAPGSPAFNERIVFNQISGMSAINTITINGNGNTLTHTATSSVQRATLLLNGTDHLTVDSLTVEATGANFGFALHLTNQADSNTFTRCNFIVDFNQTSAQHVGVVFSNTLTSPSSTGNSANYNLIENCSISGGNTGIWINGSIVHQCESNIIRGNTVHNSSLSGIRTTWQKDLVIEYNDVSRKDRMLANNFNGLFINSNRGHTRIYGNRIHGFRNPNQNSTITVIGINFNIDQPLDTTHSVLIANNLLYDFNNRGATRAIRVLANTSNVILHQQPVHVLHNSIIMEEPAATASTFIRGIEVTGNYANHRYLNNLIYLNTNSNVQTAIYFNSANPSPNRIVNHNAYYLHNGVGRIASFGNTNYNTLANWQTTGNGANSVSADPLFLRTVGASDFYRPTSVNVFATGDNVFNQVPDDIELDPRPTTPDPGAFNIVICDSAPGIPQYSDSTVLACGTSDLLIIRLINDPDAFTYHWIIPNTWSGSSDADTILISGITNQDTVYVYAENPCGLSDTLALPIIRLNPSLTASANQICLGDSVTINLVHTPSPLTDLQWNVGGSSPSITISPTETTTYALTLSQNGWTCTDSLSIEVLIPDTITDTISACDEYLWPADSVLYTSSGIYTTTLAAQNGCDSVLILNLTINTSDSLSLNLTECDSYFWDATGQTYSVSGLYTASLSNQLGCDSIVTLDLTILQSDSIVQSEVACDSYFWPISNQTYDSSGVFTQSFTKSNGCDSTHVLVLNINPSYSISQTIAACDSFTWSANNQTYFTSGNYIDTLQTQEGCDSIVSIDLTVNQSSTSSISQTSCDEYFWDANNQTYTTSGIYTATLQNSVGCDSVITLDLTILESDSIAQNQLACDSYVWPVNNQNYTNSGVYVETFNKSNGCDSILVLNLIIVQSSVTTQNVTACDSFTWSVNNQTYTASGTYTDTLTASTLCDSIVNLVLTINNSSSGTISVVACDSYTWPDNNQTYSNSGIYTAVLTNASGCDSTVSLDLQINSSDSILQSTSACESYTWPINNQIYTASGVYQETFTNANGCDSIYILDLLILQPDSVFISQVACDEYTWNETGITYTQSGTYSVTYSNSGGCDSVIQLNLIVNSGITINQEVTACDEYFWPLTGSTYTESGTYSRSYTSGSGCDSVVKLHLSIFPSTTERQVVTANVQYIWQVNGLTYNRSGIYQHVLQTQFGCDSLIILDLSITEGSTLYVPNAFSPNGHRANEQFRIFGTDIESFQILIFNRFGQMIFESNDLNISWDGNFQGSPVPMGVYVYRIQYTDSRGERYTRNGTVTVIR